MAYYLNKPFVGMENRQLTGRSSSQNNNIQVLKFEFSRGGVIIIFFSA